jgi:hypothetical protein
MDFLHILRPYLALTFSAQNPARPRRWPAYVFRLQTFKTLTEVSLGDTDEEGPMLDLSQW